MSKAYKEERQALKDKQSAMDYETVKAQMAVNSEHLVELDNLPKQNHIWIDRGLKYTCENAGHPWHEAWKVRQPMV